MSPFIQNIRTKISEIHPKDLVYPGIALLFIAITSIFFSLATKFITKSINNAFSGDTGVESSSLNMANYALVTKKLGIDTGEKKSPITETPTIADIPTEKTANPEPPQVLDKKSLTIAVLNSTTRKGVASVLAQTLESAGFAKATTGNEKKTYATTTIFIKEDKRAYTSLLTEAVRATYPEAIATTTATGTTDITIIIGTK